MNYKFWIQYPQYGCQMLRPFVELSSFKRNTIREQKVIFFYFPQISKKLKHKRDCQNLVGQYHEPSKETNLEANIRNNTLAYKQQNIPNIQGEKSIHQTYM